MGKRQKQIAFEKTDWTHRFSHGGNLRKQRKGRRERPLSKKEPIHLVFKANKDFLRGGLRTPARAALIQKTLEQYAKRFFIKIEQVTIQFDHIHVLARFTHRSNFKNFLRVFAGQVAQRFLKKGLSGIATSSRVTDTPRKTKTKLKLWKLRPFTRVIRGYQAYKTACDYVQLNELEAQGEIPYRSERLKGLLREEWEKFWS